MSAKHSRRSGKRSATGSPAAGAPAAPITPLPASRPVASTQDTASPWIDPNDPRKRMLGRVVLAGVWLYVAALWLLALDQTFHWGLFGSGGSAGLPPG